MLRHAKIGSKWTNPQGEILTLESIDAGHEQPYYFTVSDKNGADLGAERYGVRGTFFVNEEFSSYDITGPYNETAKIAAAVQSNVLNEALAVAGNGAERARDYGHPFENHERIARLWNAYDANKPTPGPDTAKDVAMKMVLLKVAREQNTHKRDNLVDIAGYILCAEQIVAKMEGK